ncbi:hypothetical protein VNI00_007952 [Paramarasmius palmivorus]|uniref:Uncharacterized protein n=1 Tax=Paramarasmius palmivorus TaxID=297713 RepID=A0AAW0CZI7_9AGAR
MASAEVLNASETATEPQLIREEGALLEPKKGGEIEISLQKENGDALDVVGNEATVDASQDTIVNVKDVHATNGIDSDIPTKTLDITAGPEDTDKEVNEADVLSIEKALNGHGAESSIGKAIPPAELEHGLSLTNGTKDQDTVPAHQTLGESTVVNGAEDATLNGLVTAPVEQQPSEPEAGESVEGQLLDPKSPIEGALAAEQDAEPIKENATLALEDSEIIDGVPAAPDIVEAEDSGELLNGAAKEEDGVVEPLVEAVVEIPPVQEEGEVEALIEAKEVEAKEVASQPLETQTADVSVYNAAEDLAESAAVNGTSDNVADLPTPVDFVATKEDKDEDVVQTSPPVTEPTVVPDAAPQDASDKSEVVEQNAVAEEVREVEEVSEKVEPATEDTTSGSVTDGAGEELQDDSKITPVQHPAVVDAVPHAPDTVVDEIRVQVDSDAQAAEPQGVMAEDSVVEPSHVEEESAVPVAEPVEEKTNALAEESSLAVDISAPTDTIIPIETASTEVQGQEAESAQQTSDDQKHEIHSVPVTAAEEVHAVVEMEDTSTDGDQAVQDAAIEQVTEAESVAADTVVEDVTQEDATAAPIVAHADDPSVAKDVDQSTEKEAVDTANEVKTEQPVAPVAEEVAPVEDVQQGAAVTSEAAHDAVDPIPTAPDTVREENGSGAETESRIAEKEDDNDEEVAIPVDEATVESIESKPQVTDISESTVNEQDTTVTTSDPVHTESLLDAEQEQVDNLVKEEPVAEQVVNDDKAEEDSKAQASRVPVENDDAGAALLTADAEVADQEDLSTQADTSDAVETSVEPPQEDSVPVVESNGPVLGVEEVVSPETDAANIESQAETETNLPVETAPALTEQLVEATTSDEPVRDAPVEVVEETAKETSEDAIGEAAVTDTSVGASEVQLEEVQELQEQPQAPVVGAATESSSDATKDQLFTLIADSQAEPTSTDVTLNEDTAVEQTTADAVIEDRVAPPAPEDSNVDSTMETAINEKDTQEAGEDASADLNSVKDAEEDATVPSEDVVSPGDESESDAEEEEEPVIVPRRARALTVVTVTVEQEVHVHDHDPHAPADSQDDRREPCRIRRKALVPPAEEEAALSTDDTRSSQLDVQSSDIERPKSPWTPSYSVTSQGPSIAAEEDIPEIERLPPSSEPEEASKDTATVPVVNVFIPDTTEGEVEAKQGDKEEERERPTSPWTPSYSVSQQGSPAAVVKEIEEAQDPAPEPKEEVAEATNVTEVTEETIATTADVPEKVAAPEVEDSTKVEVPTVVIPGAEAEEANETTEVTEEPSRPKSPWTPSYSVSRQGSPAPPVPELPKTEETEPVELVNEETVADVKMDEQAATPEVHVSQADETDVPPTSADASEQANEDVIKAEDLAATDADVPPRPTSPWTPSYSVSVQGSPQPPASDLPAEAAHEAVVQPPAEESSSQSEGLVVETTAVTEETPVAPEVALASEPTKDEEVKVADVKVDESADLAVESEVEAVEQQEQQEKAVLPSLEIPQAPAQPEPESKSPWTPSYSVTTQGTDTNSEEIASKDEEEVAQEPIVVAPVPVAAKSSESVCPSPLPGYYGDANEPLQLTVDTNSTATPDRPRSPWTPSYSVMRQGSGVMDEDKDEAELDRLEKLPEPVEKQGTEATHADDPVSVSIEAPSENATEEAKPEEKSIEPFPSAQDDQRSLTSLDTVTKDDSQPLPSPSARSRLASTASSLIFPGGWFSKAPAGRTSLDNAKGEFAASTSTSKPTSPVEPMPQVEEGDHAKDVPETEAAQTAEEVPATSPTSISSEEKKRWCIIM